MTERPYFITSDAVAANPAIEMHSPEKRKSSLVVAGAIDYTRFVNDLSERNNFWLPAAAERLNISPNLKDYVIAPTVSMPSDLPNRNGMAFPLEELTGWLTDRGMPMYRSWVGMPTFVEHQNSDPTKAKGIILDCRMLPLKNSAGDIWKVVKLLAFDRTRDAVLANDIWTGRRSCYSMGANAADFTCSVCANRLSDGQCEHVGRPSDPPRFKEYNGVLAFNQVRNPVGFECSSVLVPAYTSSGGSKPLNWGDFG